MTPYCPLCKSPPSYIEHLAPVAALNGREWLRQYFCNGCGRCFLLNDDGICVHSERTNHERPTPRETSS